MTVIIGIDPHKSSHTAVAIGCDEQTLGQPNAILLDDVLVARDRAARDLHLLEAADAAHENVNRPSHLHSES